MDWVNTIGYAVAIGAALLLIGGMFLPIRVLADDSGRFQELKEMVDTLFNTPSHLRPDSPNESPNRAAEASAPGRELPLSRTPFEDECPACAEPVTHRNEFCPSCGLLLLDG
jgi:hypothetical protein